ncbi:sulfotransferase family protein [Tateyamaria pelophila]|uniref:sulfotransferase family protein n=1 Tax=Tateyamaria pelophila TaxID=328415 RepID=UPI001CBFA8CE|nr:sulfotransferase family protein [Tateyamaria pelophila]
MSKVFGIGLHKTGTTTLGTCFRELGFDHLSCRKDLLAKLRKGEVEAIYSEIDKYQSFEDWPYPLMYKELAERYPDAKFILTLRKDADVWLRSFHRHSLRRSSMKNAQKLAYGVAYTLGNEEYLKEFYKTHEADVRAFFAQTEPDRLLVLCWETGSGWDELCSFLGLDVPATPFPHENKDGTAKKSIRLTRRKYVNLINMRFQHVMKRLFAGS